MDAYYVGAGAFMTSITDAFRPVRDYIAAKGDAAASAVVHKERSRKGGHLLFRPLGLGLVTEVLCKIWARTALAEGAQAIATLPLRFEVAPFRGIIWDSARGLVITKGRTLARDLLMYMCGRDVSDLEERYREALDDKSASLRGLPRL